MTEKITLRNRSDLTLIPAFAACDKDTSGQPIVLTNVYECETDGYRWEDDWSCACDDECAECGESASPNDSYWSGPEAPIMEALWEGLPERGDPASEGVNFGKIVVTIDGGDVLVLPEDNPAAVNKAFVKYLPEESPQP